MKIYSKAKCRNCGEIFVIDTPDEVDISKEELVKLISIEKITEQSQCVHICNDNEFGIADCIALVVKE